MKKKKKELMAELEELSKRHEKIPGVIEASISFIILL
jgi:hypothetical protein